MTMRSRPSLASVASDHRTITRRQILAAGMAFGLGGAALLHAMPARGAGSLALLPPSSIDPAVFSFGFVRAAVAVGDRTLGLVLPNTWIRYDGPRHPDLVSGLSVMGRYGPPAPDDGGAQVLIGAMSVNALIHPRIWTCLKSDQDGLTLEDFAQDFVVRQKVYNQPRVHVLARRGTMVAQISAVLEGEVMFVAVMTTTTSLWDAYAGIFRIAGDNFGLSSYLTPMGEQGNLIFQPSLIPAEILNVAPGWGVSQINRYTHIEVPDAVATLPGTPVSSHWESQLIETVAILNRGGGPWGGDGQGRVAFSGAGRGLHEATMAVRAFNGLSEDSFPRNHTNWWDQENEIRWSEVSHFWLPAPSFNGAVEMVSYETRYRNRNFIARVGEAGGISMTACAPCDATADWVAADIAQSFVTEMSRFA